MALLLWLDCLLVYSTLIRHLCICYRLFLLETPCSLAQSSSPDWPWPMGWMCLCWRGWCPDQHTWETRMPLVLVVHTILFWWVPNSLICHTNGERAEFYWSRQCWLEEGDCWGQLPHCSHSPPLAHESNTWAKTSAQENWMYLHLHKHPLAPCPPPLRKHVQHSDAQIPGEEDKQRVWLFHFPRSI